LLTVCSARQPGEAAGLGLLFSPVRRVEAGLRSWSQRYRSIGRLVAGCERFVRKTNYVGVYVLLSIPVMSDTIPIYLYALFNEEGKALNRTAFLVANFLAAWTRAGFVVFAFLVLNVFLGG